jgi:hypothetical protein
MKETTIIMSMYDNYTKRHEAYEGLTSPYAVFGATDKSIHSFIGSGVLRVGQALEVPVAVTCLEDSFLHRLVSAYCRHPDAHTKVLVHTVQQSSNDINFLQHFQEMAYRSTTENITVIMPGVTIIPFAVHKTTSVIVDEKFTFSNQIDTKNAARHNDKYTMAICTKENTPEERATCKIAASVGTLDGLTRGIFSTALVSFNTTKNALLRAVSLEALVKQEIEGSEGVVAPREFTFSSVSHVV